LYYNCTIYKAQTFITKERNIFVFIVDAFGPISNAIKV